MILFDETPPNGFERLLRIEDKSVGLFAYICIHSTDCGPAAGGCRVWNYADASAARTDALRLAEGMSYKNAVAGIGLGGGKSVIWANARDGLSEELLHQFGSAVQSLGGSYYTAEDVGMSTQAMAVVAEKTDYAVGLDTGAFASGDPSPFTAEGVFQCLKQGAAHVFGSDDLRSRRVLVQGLGHVGMSLAEKLAEAGASLIVADLDAASLERAKTDLGAEICSVDAVFSQKMDVFAPCALGGILNPETVPQLTAKLVCGAANNQLATPDAAQALQDRGITYLPDYIANAGGIISVAGEIHHQGPDYRQARLGDIAQRMQDILALSKTTGRTTEAIARELATRLIAEAKLTKDPA